MFFICGDRVWPAIPTHIIGGPCSIGKLILPTPSAKMSMKHRGKRSINQCKPDYKDDLNVGVFEKGSHHLFFRCFSTTFSSFILRHFCSQRVRVLSLALCLPKFLHIPFLMQPPLLLQVGRHRSLCTVFCWFTFTQISSLS